MNHHIIFVCANGQKVGFDHDAEGPSGAWEEGGMTEEEMELVQEVCHADLETGASYRRPMSEPLIIAPYEPLTVGELDAAKMLRDRKGTPDPQFIVDLVARGWATSQYLYPLGKLTPKGEAELAKELSASENALPECEVQG